MKSPVPSMTLDEIRCQGHTQSNNTPRASARKRTQRGSFFAPTYTIQGPTP